MGGGLIPAHGEQHEGSKEMSSRNEQVKEAAQLLEQGVADIFDSGRFAEYLDVMSRFHHYSARNCVLIMMQCPEATHVASYKKWQKDFNRQVRKGEKAIRILAPIQLKKTLRGEDEHGNEVEKEVSWLGFKAVPVFDISQTDGDDLPEIATDLTGDVDGFNRLCDSIAKVATVPVEWDVDITDPMCHGYFDRGENRICIRGGMSQNQTVKTLVHEVAHSILHKDGGEQEQADRHVREVQAEGVAYVVCRCLGIDSSDYSFGYLAGWGGTKETLASLDVIRRTANEILDAVSA